MSVDRQRARDWALAGLVWTGTLVVLFWPLVRGLAVGDPHFFDWDVPEQYWPDLVRLCRDLHGGGVPHWSPHDRGGYAYDADPQAAPFHPMNWALCAAAGPTPSLHWASLRVVLGFLVALAGAHLWLRRTPLGRGPTDAPPSHAASALGAVVLATAPFLRHNWELNLTLGIAWTPWILAAIDALLARPAARTAALLALASAACAWSGSPPALWLTATFATGYLALRLARSASTAAGTPPLPWRRVALFLALAGVLALALTAVVILPGQALSARSVQADHTYASLAAEGLDADALRAIVSPRPGNHLFLGPVVWLGAGAALASRRSRAVALACLIVSVLAVLLAMGDHGPLFRLAFEHVPGFDRFRLPHRYEAWLGPPAALATALGADVLTHELARAREGRRGAIAWAVALLLVPTHLSLVTLRLDPERHTRGGPIPCRDADDVLAAVVRDSPDRIFDEFALGCRAGTRLSLRDLRGYQDPLMLHAYERVLSHLAERPGLLRQFGVRHALTSPHFLHGWDHHYLPRPEILTSLPGARTVARDGARRVIDLGTPVPRAYVVPAASVVAVPSREEALARLLPIAPAPVAIVERDETGAETVAASTIAPSRGVAVATDPDADTVVVSLEATPAGVLVLNDVYDEGWTAEVDGAPTPVLRVNALVRGVTVPAGAREVVFRFAPPLGRTLRALWAAAWLLTLLCLASPRRARRRAA